MPLFNFERGYNFCNTFLSPEMIFLRKTGVILSRLLKCDREYSGSLAIMRWVRDTGDSRTLSTTIYKYLQLSTTIAASPEISGFPSHSDHSAVSEPRHDQLQISRDIANTGKHPQHLPDICFLGENENALLWQLHSYSLDKKTLHRSSVPICRNIYYLLVLMNETFC